MIYATKPCPGCDKQFKLDLDPAAVASWRDGAYAQDVFPELSVGERELLISGTCPPCWDAMFGTDDEYEDDEDD